jgi:hypothetical protein
MEGKVVFATIGTCSTQPSIAKCSHGDYIPPGCTTAPYCPFCNEAVNKVIAAPKRRCVPHDSVDKVLDTAEYLDLPVGVRIAQGRFAE